MSFDLINPAETVKGSCELRQLSICMHGNPFKHFGSTQGTGKPLATDWKICINLVAATQWKFIWSPKVTTMYTQGLVQMIFAKNN